MAMSSVFPRRYLDEDGNVNTYIKSNYMRTAAFTKANSGTITGAMISMYDIDTTTYYQFGTSGANWGKWDFKSKKKFKSIYVYGSYDLSGTGSEAGRVWNLEGSNDDSAWTNIDTVTNPQVVGTCNLLGTDATWRYIRVTMGSVSGYVRINAIMGVI